MARPKCNVNHILKNALIEKGPDLTDEVKFKEYFDLQIDPVMPIQNQGCWGSCHLQADAAVINQSIQGSPIDTAYLLGARQYDRTMELIKKQYGLMESDEKIPTIFRFIGKIKTKMKMNEALKKVFSAGGNAEDDLRLLASWTGKRVEIQSVPVFEDGATITSAVIRDRFKADLEEALKIIRTQKLPIDQAVKNVDLVYQKYFGEVFVDRAVSSKTYRSGIIRTVRMFDQSAAANGLNFTKIETMQLTRPVVSFEGKERKVKELRTLDVSLKREVYRFNEDGLHDYLIQKIGKEKKALTFSMTFSDEAKIATKKGSFEDFVGGGKPTGGHRLYIRGLKTKFVNGKKRVLGLQIVNSWGAGVGVKGEVYIPMEKLHELDFYIEEMLIDY